MESTDVIRKLRQRFLHYSFETIEEFREVVFCAAAGVAVVLSIALLLWEYLSWLTSPEYFLVDWFLLPMILAGFAYAIARRFKLERLRTISKYSFILTTDFAAVMNILLYQMVEMSFYLWIGAVALAGMAFKSQAIIWQAAIGICTLVILGIANPSNDVYGVLTFVFIFYSCMIFIFISSFEHLVSAYEQKTEALRVTRKNDKQLFNKLAHKLKTPLAAIVVELDSMKSELTNYQTIERFVQDTKKGIEEIINMSKLNLSVVKADTKVVSVSEFFEAVIADAVVLCNAYKKLTGKTRAISFELSPSLRNAQMEVAPDQLREAFLNYFDNSIKHNERRKTVHITVVINRKWDRCEINLQDDGVGFANQATDSSSHIGLKISENIIKAHDGTVKITSVLKQGTRVLVSLPLA